MGQGRSDYILGVIRIIVWIFWINVFLKEDNPKGYGWTWMKFVFNV